MWKIENKVLSKKEINHSFWNKLKTKENHSFLNAENINKRIILLYYLLIYKYIILKHVREKIIINKYY